MNIGVIGTGNMAGSMIKGLMNKGHKICIYNRTIKKAQQYKNEDVTICNNEFEVIENSDILILGLKPDKYISWLENHDLKETILISIAAGMTSDKLSQVVDNFIITMPNTPSLVQKGYTLIVESNSLTPEIVKLFKSFGDTKIIKENELDIYMLISGCAPAYFFSYVDIMTKVFVEEYNLNAKEVESILISVMGGATTMLNSDTTARELTANVCSPGGVTIEVVNELQTKLPDIFKCGLENALEKNEMLKGK